MQSFDKPKNPFRSGFLILALTSLLALLWTFLVSSSELEFDTKLTAFVVIFGGYLAFCGIFYFLQNRRAPETTTNGEIFNAEIEEKLLALEEASRFFGASLKPADMFRLVASRVNEIIPADSFVLFLADERNSAMKVAHAFGKNAEPFAETEINLDEGLAGKTFLTREAQADDKLFADRGVIQPNALANLFSAVSVPLRRDAEVFGVFALYAEKIFDKSALPLIEAIGERIAPLFASSLAFEKTVENALTDTQTNLPNQRAFYLVLESQIAESQRYPKERPLTVLSIDIRNFAKLNERFGHTRGDQILGFAAQIIKAQLRQMDFLSRSAGDEFLAVLPTASDEIKDVIVERIEKAFAANAFELSRNESEFIRLNFGAASFLKDGETAPELLQAALLDKMRAKSPQKNSILRFPKNSIN